MICRSLGGVAIKAVFELIVLTDVGLWVTDFGQLYYDHFNCDHLHAAPRPKHPLEKGAHVLHHDPLDHEDRDVDDDHDRNFDDEDHDVSPPHPWME